MIEIEGLRMRFGDLLAVDGVELMIPQGELFAFLGPNGAGKTTTIRNLTGLLKPTSGCVRICGIDMFERPTEAKARVGYVPDVPVFYEKLTAMEFMHFIGDLFDVPEERAAEAGGELFETLHLVEYANQQIETLSHGTKQRLAIASALLHEPEVMVIDEPMIGLDPLHARTVKEQLMACADRGMTVFMSTHLLNIAEEMADRIGIINRGKLIAVGALEDLKAGGNGEAGDALEKIFLDLVAEDSSSTG
ncbi:MAG: ABC transporter ATP-binding protein [Verrucomicrobiota bacterium]